MCGNFGLLASAGADENRIQAILLDMAALTELRGALGGGIATVSWEYDDSSSTLSYKSQHEGGDNP